MATRPPPSLQYTPLADTSMRRTIWGEWEYKE